MLIAALGGALFLSFRALFVLSLFQASVPEETSHFPLSPSHAVRAAVEAWWPPALYLLLVIFARKTAWSDFGRMVFVAQLVYIAILAGVSHALGAVRH